MHIAVYFNHRVVAELLARGLRAHKAVREVDVIASRRGLMRGLRASKARLFVMDGVTPSTAIVADNLQTLRSVHPAAPVLLLARDDRELLRTALRFGVTGIVEEDATAEHCLNALQQLSQGHSWLPAELVGELVNGHRPGHTDSPLAHLSARQRQVLDLIGTGLSTRQIAELLGIGVKTVETHRARLMQSLGLRRAHELVVMAVQTQGNATR